jgi:hypothetical protein
MMILAKKIALLEVWVMTEHNQSSCHSSVVRRDGTSEISPKKHCELQCFGYNHPIILRYISGMRK